MARRSSSTAAGSRRCEGSMTAFAPGSVSFRIYPHDLPAADAVAVMREQARRAVEAGFDGVMTSEHHGGFAGYTPNPIQLSGWRTSTSASAAISSFEYTMPVGLEGLLNRNTFASGRAASSCAGVSL